MTWATLPTSCRDSGDPDWTNASPRSCRDGLLYVEEGYWDEGYAEIVYPAWADFPTSCRDFVELDAGLGVDLDCLSVVNLDAGVGVDFDCLSGTGGVVTTARGWTISTPRSCRDG